MKVKLRYGYRDLEDVEVENAQYSRGLHLTTVLYEEGGEVYVIISSEWKFEIKKYVERFLGDLKALADSIVAENIVQK